MCDYCRESAENLILGIIDKGYELSVAIRLARDMVIQSGLADPENVTSLGDVVKMSDDVTEAGDRLRSLAEHI
jgi:hypothetical protein